LPFSSFSLARSILNAPNANLMACSIVVSFYFVSLSSSNLIGFGVRIARPMAGRLHQERPMRTEGGGKALSEEVKGRFGRIPCGGRGGGGREGGRGGRGERGAGRWRGAGGGAHVRACVRACAV
jgi:hypothetical protein